MRQLLERVLTEEWWILLFPLRLEVSYLSLCHLRFNRPSSQSIRGSGMTCRSSVRTKLCTTIIRSSSVNPCCCANLASVSQASIKAWISGPIFGCAISRAPCSHTLSRCGTRKAPKYYDALGDLDFERRRECQSNAQIMRSASPPPTAASNAVLASMEHLILRVSLSLRAKNDAR